MNSRHYKRWRLFGLVLFGARVGGIVDFGQVGEVQAGVDLRGGELFVAEQFLYGANVLRAL